MSDVRVAVVTGANKGIGFAVVKGLCERFDGHVYLTSRDIGRGHAAVEEIKKLGLDPKYHWLDINDEASIEKLHDFLQQTYGGLDVLVNNAAIAYKMASTAPFAEQAERTLYTNFTANHNVCKLLFPLLRPHARVVNVSSMLGQLSSGIKGADLKKELKSDSLTTEHLCKLMQQFVDHAKAGDHLAHGWGGSAYSVSKVGLTALSRVQQKEFEKDSREDITVTAVEPGYVSTDMTSHKGHLTIEQGADPIIFCCLLPHNSDNYKGAYVSQKKNILEWH